MNRYQFWLASASPRRREMLGWSGWPLNLSPSNVVESLSIDEQPEDQVQRLAMEKCRSQKDVPAEDFVIAADTIVVMDHTILGKPTSATDAFKMLSDLRGSSHWVMTAIAIRRGNQAEASAELCKTEVSMRTYTDGEIDQYIQSGDPMDKAGAYAIQNKRFSPVIDFNGCMASVMGMPLCHLERTLRRYNGYEKTDWPGICQIHLKYACPITERVIAGEDIG